MKYSFFAIALVMAVIALLAYVFRKPLRRAAYLWALHFRLPSAPSGRVEFANIGEGTHEHGIISLTPTAGGASRYLFWSRNAGANTCTITAANAAPLGTSDDYVDTASYLAQGIAVKIFGAIRGTVRVVTDGTCTDGNPVKVGASGQAALWTHGTDSGTNYACGVAIISPDSTANANDVIEIIPICPALTFR